MYAIHAVVIPKSIPLEKAKKLASNFIPENKKFYRETTESYRFRNIPKQKFEPKSFRSKVINDEITLIFGNLKESK